jgi:hypothetical protein
LRVETTKIGTERGSAPGSPAPDRPIDAQPATRIKAQPASMKHRRLAIFCHRAGSRRETPRLPSRAIAPWFKLWSRLFGTIDVLANAAKFAKNLTEPASCIWYCGSIRFWPSNMSGMRHYRHRPIVRRIEPRQLLTEDVQVDVGRGRMTAPALTLELGGQMGLHNVFCMMYNA